MGMFSNPFKAITSFANSAANTLIPLRQPNRFLSSSAHTTLPLIPGARKGAHAAEKGLFNKRKINDISNSSIQPINPVPQKSSNFLANAHLTDKLRNQLYRDQLALNSSNYPIYKGETTAPMSQLTEKARMLREEGRNKPAPYSKKIETLLKKEATGFSPDQTRELLNILNRGNDTDRNIILQRLNKQFGNNYGYEDLRADKLGEKLNRDTARSSEMLLQISKV